MYYDYAESSVLVPELVPSKKRKNAVEAGLPKKKTKWLTPGVSIKFSTICFNKTITECTCYHSKYLGYFLEKLFEDNSIQACYMT